MPFYDSLILFSKGFPKVENIFMPVFCISVLVTFPIKMPLGELFVCSKMFSSEKVFVCDY